MHLTYHESENFSDSSSLHHIFPFFNQKSPNLGMKKLQKIIGDLLDEPGKLYMNRTVISKFLAVLK